MIARNMHKLRGTNVHAYTYKGQRRDPAAVKVARGQPAGDHSSRIVEMGKTDVYRDTMMFSKISESIILSLFKMAPKMVLSTIFWYPIIRTRKNGYFGRKYRYILNFCRFCGNGIKMVSSTVFGKHFEKNNDV